MLQLHGCAEKCIDCECTGKRLRTARNVSQQAMEDTTFARLPAPEFNNVIAAGETLKPSALEVPLLKGDVPPWPAVADALTHSTCCPA